MICACLPHRVHAVRGETSGSQSQRRCIHSNLIIQNLQNYLLLPIDNKIMGLFINTRNNVPDGEGTG